MASSKAMKVYEFKAELSPVDVASFDRYTEGLRVLWNYANAIRVEGQQDYYRRLAGRCPIPASMKLKKTKKGRIVGAGVKTRKKDGAKYCQIFTRCDRTPLDLQLQQRTQSGQNLPPSLKVKRLKGGRVVGLGVKTHPKTKGKCCAVYLGASDEDAATATRSAKNWRHPALDGVPSVYRDSIIRNTLKDSWQRFFGGLAKPPKMKRKGEAPKTLANLSPGNNTKIFKAGQNAWVHLPGLTPIKVKGFYKRFPDGLRFSKVALTKDGGDFYIQFTAEFIPVDVERSPARQIGVDPGVKLAAATSDGARIKPRKANQRRQSRLKRLQRKASRQYEAAKKRGSGYPFSNGWLKTKKAIARIHAKERRNRKAFNAKVADGLGRFDVAFEGSRLQNISRRAKPKKREDGKGHEKNGAKRKSGLNRALLNNGLGQLRQLTEARCKSRKREFIKTEDQDVRYSSRRCHCCGEIGSRPTQELFACQNEGCWHFGKPQNADVNAAKNHKLAGFNLPREATPVQSGKVKREKSGATQAAQAERSVKPLGRSRDSIPEPHSGDLGGVKPHTTTQNSSTPRKQGRSPKPKPQVLAKPPTEPRQLSLWEDGAIGA